jgi:nitrate/nitrite transporter NarK
MILLLIAALVGTAGTTVLLWPLLGVFALLVGPAGGSFSALLAAVCLAWRASETAVSAGPDVGPETVAVT